jgi:hypothetical protein
MTYLPNPAVLRELLAQVYPGHRLVHHASMEGLGVACCSTGKTCSVRRLQVATATGRQQQHTVSNSYMKFGQGLMQLEHRHHCCFRQHATLTTANTAALCLHQDPSILTAAQQAYGILQQYW